MPTVAIEAEFFNLEITKPVSAPTIVATPIPANIAIGNASVVCCKNIGSSESEVSFTATGIDKIPVVYADIPTNPK